MNGRDFTNEGKLMDLINGSEYVPTYEDKDGDWMLVGDVPWELRAVDGEHAQCDDLIKSWGVFPNLATISTSLMGDEWVNEKEVCHLHVVLWRNRSKADRDGLCDETSKRSNSGGIHNYLPSHRESPDLSILSVSRDNPAHFWSSDPTNLICDRGETLSLSSSAERHILLTQPLHPRHTAAARISSMGDSRFRTSTMHDVGRIITSSSSSSSSSTTSGTGVPATSSSARAGTRAEEARFSSEKRARRRPWPDRGRSGAGPPSAEGQVCPFLGRPQRPQL
ncbi:hypothetical protein C4D60_Mb04t28180 [Musa balbisiana]|uniref:Auxin-responsive protein n=1 Tax=Musa balbisiana TaxID=52838 RepID=A0A4S8KF82_MUSBA|nr:hypothetical protein C4D60_Mb04t28180 [Musa balbisiana]